MKACLRLHGFAFDGGVATEGHPYKTQFGFLVVGGYSGPGTFVLLIVGLILFLLLRRRG